MTDSDTPTSERIADWLTEVMSRPAVERPLRMATPGALNTAKGLAYVYNETHDDAALSVQQMAQGLATLRDRESEFEITVEGVTEYVDTGNEFGDGLTRWRVEA